MAEKNNPDMLLVRVDADRSIGAGHLMRCLALAEHWKASGGDVLFVSSCRIDAVCNRVRDQGFRFVSLERTYPNPDDLDQTIEQAREYAPAWVVLDGYHFDPAYQEDLKARVDTKLLIIDDSAQYDHYHADILLNQNLYAAELNYRCDPKTIKLLGPRYVLLRSEFLKWRSWKRTIPRVATRLLVTLGGASGSEDYSRAVEILERMEPGSIECDIVIGSTKLKGQVEERILKIPSEVRLHGYVDEISSMMAHSDLALSSSGSTAWEMAFMGLPIVLVVLSDNQDPVATALESLGAVRNLGRLIQLESAQAVKTMQEVMQDPDTRWNMSRQLRELVDGKGVERILSRMRAF